MEGMGRTVYSVPFASMLEAVDRAPICMATLFAIKGANRCRRTEQPALQWAYLVGVAQVIHELDSFLGRGVGRQNACLAVFAVPLAAEAAIIAKVWSV